MMRARPSNGRPIASSPRRANGWPRLPERAVDEPFTLVHGSPRDPTWEYVFTAGIARAQPVVASTPSTAWSAIPTSPSSIARKAGAWRASRSTTATTIKLGSQRVIANPGSVGQPRDGDPRASAMILDTDSRHAGMAPRRVSDRTSPEADGRAQAAAAARRAGCSTACDRRDDQMSDPSDRPARLDEAVAARPQARRPTHARRAAACPVLPLFRPGHARRARVRLRAADGHRPGARERPPRAVRPARCRSTRRSTSG